MLMQNVIYIYYKIPYHLKCRRVREFQSFFSFEIPDNLT